MKKINKYLSIFTISLLSSTARAETGFDWNFNNGQNLSSTLDRIDKDGFGHQNYLKFEFEI